MSGRPIGDLLRCRGLVVLALIATVSAFGCGYQLAGRGSFLPSDIEVIGVPPFESQVPRSELVEAVTEHVTSEFLSRGYRVSPSRAGADAVLEGTITGLSETPVAFDEQGRAVRSQLTINVSVKLVRTRSDVVLYENPSLFERTELELDPSTELFDRESEGIAELAEKFAKTVVATIVESF